MQASNQVHLYNLTVPYEENVTFGPYWDGPLPERSERGKPVYSLFGIPLHSTFGIPACPLTVSARSVELCSRLGYDVLTFKTVRSIEWHGNTFPHWKYADYADSIPDPRKNDTSVATSFDPFANQDISMVNSFGIHSLRPEYWQMEYERAKHSLSEGQVLILSLLPSTRETCSLVQDAEEVAHYADETSAEIIEVNLACPNTDGGKGLIYEDTDLSIAICKAMKTILGDKPLLVKVGYYHDKEQLNQFLKETNGIIHGLSSMNTYSIKAVDTEGIEAFPGRPTAGLSGAAIRSMAMEQAKQVLLSKSELALSNEFIVIGIGGVTAPHHIQAYLDIGVNAVQSAVGVWNDPYLAQKYFHK